MRKTFFLLVALFSVGMPAVAQYAWTQKASYPGPARHRAFAFSVGQRGYLGTGHTNAVVDVLYDDMWEYDPASNTWSQKANYPGGVRHNAISFTIGNKGYVGTGRGPFGNTNDFWEYDPVTNTWAAKAFFPGSARRGAVGFAINGKGYLSCGSDNTMYRKDLWEYDPVNNFWVQRPDMPGNARTQAVAFVIGNKGYVGTGEGTSTSIYDFYCYDPVNFSWSQVASIAGDPRTQACGFGVNGKGYVTTGISYWTYDNLQDCWEYDANTNLWTQAADFPGIARRYMRAFTIGKSAFAGSGTSGTNLADLWEFASPVGVEETAAVKEISLFPNPMTTHASLRLDAGTSERLFQLFDLAGKEVMKQHIPAGASEIGISRGAMAAGTYICKLSADGIITGTGKLVIR